MISQNTVMLHICCAPDATVPWAELGRDFELLGYFYGSNIHPAEEYERRRAAVEKLMEYVKGQCIYPAPSSSWGGGAAPLSAAPLKKEDIGNASIPIDRSLADEPEGGKRCALCFRRQLEHTARAALDLGCSHMCTTLTISPHKDAALINSIGNEIAANSGITWVERVWRKNNGFLNSVKISKALGLYRQNYCGCVYSKPAVL